LEEGDESAIDYTKAQEIIDHAYELGVNYYDTAYIYHGGNSELFLSKALSKYPRDSYYLADKYNLHAKPDYRKQFAEQLERLNTDYIDFYLLHGLQDPNIDFISENDCIPYFESLKAEGKIKYFGFSFHGSPGGFKRLLPMHNWDFVMIQLNYYDWVYGDAKELYEMAAEKNIPIMVMEPLRGGLLASLTEKSEKMLKELEPNRSIASWWMRWIMGLPQITTVLSGMSDINQLKDNIATFTEHKALKENEISVLLEACEIFRPTIAAPCTNCRYCIADCPKGLDIPRLISIYNDVKLNQEWRISFLGNLSSEQQPSNCIVCNICVKRCPQDLDIPSYITELVNLKNETEQSS
jgi:predicted aldo/keto reductase-like oxidoreductase